MRKSLTVLTILLAGALSISIAAQLPAPTFKSNVNAVLMDVRVVDADGNLVRDLAKDDFQVEEDGKPQTISTFELVDIPPDTSEGQTFAGKPIDSDVATNEDSEGRLYMIVLDDLGMHPLRSPTVRALGREFIEKHVGPRDRVALTTTSGRKDMTLEFTNDRERLLTAIDKFEGGYGPGLSLAHPLDELKALADWMAPIDGRRKTVVLISQGLPSGLPNLPNDRPSDTVDLLDPTIDTSDDFSIFDTFDQQRSGTFDLRDVIDEAAHNNVSFYTIDPAGHPGTPSPDVALAPYLLAAGDDFPGDSPFARTTGQDTLDVLAAETGGASLVRSNNFNEAFDRIVDDASSYYLLGYSSTAKRDGKFHHITVNTRPGLHVRTRTGYVALGEKPDKPTKAARAGAWPAELVSTIQSPVQLPGVKMNVGASAFRGKNGLASVEVVVETHGAGLLQDQDAQHADGAMGLLIVAADENGHIKASHNGGLSMRLTPETRAAVDAFGLRVLNRLELKPGRYVMRVAATDNAASAKGSVHYTLDVPDFSRGPLTMSGLALSSTAEQKRPTTGSDTNWAQRFGAPPTATRAFLVGEELSVFEDIYRNDKKLGTVTVTTTVRSEADDVVFREQQGLGSAVASAGGLASDSIHTKIPLKGLQAGSYLLTVDARASANMKASASRQILFSVR
jgi:VWFA-related protein